MRMRMEMNDKVDLYSWKENTDYKKGLHQFNGAALSKKINFIKLLLLLVSKLIIYRILPENQR